MLRTVVRLTPALIPILENRNQNDYNLLEPRTPDISETGRDRLKKMFYRNEYDEVSPELRTVVQSGLCGVFFGACMGGFAKSRDAYLYFIENNQATIFQTTMEAKKKLQDYVMIGFAKGAYHWGWRLGIFTGTFSLIATTISVYRNETSITEYILAGTITGAIYKANLGMAAMMVGAGLGAVLSTIGGAAILGILKVTGVTMHDIRRALNKISEARTDQFNQAKEKAAEIKHDSLTKHHDRMVEQKGEIKIEEIK
ncbi:RPII140-upstream gene protein [Choristoneura fumiferana]|uniref:RPII140-upstream gene protein n=1 Tax=Choristoneura fumiferana TaxID=7141 RepID=UPI003D15DC23